MNSEEDIGKAPDTENYPASTKLVLSTLFLFAFWPSVNFISENITLGINPGFILAVSGVIYLISVGCLFLSWRLFRQTQRERIAATFCVATFGVFMIQPVRAAAHLADVSVSIMAAWSVTVLIAMTITWLVVFNRKSFLLLTTVATVGFTLASAGVAIQLFNASGFADTKSQATQNPDIANGSTTPITGAPPPVVYVIVDAYPRSDEILRQTGYDISGFIDTLDGLGFRTLKKSISNYFFSNLSISSTLSMRYLMDTENNEIETYEEIRPIISGKNDVAQRFTDLGYSMVTSGVRLCSNLNHTCIVNNSGLPHEMWQFLLTTPFPVILSYLSPTLYGRTSAGREYHMKDLTNKISNFSLSNRFLLIHELGVHDNLYNADCSFQTKLAQTDLKRQNRQDRQLDEIQPFVQTVQCINKLITQFVEMIIRKNSDSIIIVTADHGTGFSREFGETSAPVIRERSAVLSSWRLPPRCNDLLYDEMSNVNHFRAIFACLTGEKPNYLNDKVFSGLIYDDIRKAEVPK